MWSLGVLLDSLIRGKLANIHEDRRDARNDIGSFGTPVAVRDLADGGRECVKLLRALLAKDWRHRPTAPQTWVSNFMAQQVGGAPATVSMGAREAMQVQFERMRVVTRYWLWYMLNKSSKWMRVRCSG